MTTNVTQKLSTTTQETTNMLYTTTVCILEPSLFIITTYFKAIRTMTWNYVSTRSQNRGVFRTLSNIHDGAFCVQKHSILDVWQGSEYAFDIYFKIFTKSSKSLVLCRGIYRSLSNIYNGVLLRKQLTTFRKP